jgi:hypothetical protein
MSFRHLINDSPRGQKRAISLPNIIACPIACMLSMSSLAAQRLPRDFDGIAGGR